MELTYKDKGTFTGVYSENTLLGSIKKQQGKFIYYPAKASAKFKSEPFDKIEDLKKQLEID